MTVTTLWLAVGRMVTILFVDDDPEFTAAVRPLLEREGYAIHVAHSLTEARTLLGQQTPQLMFIDLLLPDGSGLELVSDHGPRTIIITGHPSIDSAIRAIRGSVVDYLVKPVDSRQLRKTIRRALDSESGSGASDEAADSDHRLAVPLVGESAPMMALRSLIRDYGETDVTLLITGESGTGKELVAQAVHEIRGGDKPFIALNCAVIPQELLASELFGHEKGSFTGAAKRHRGLFERAEDGTVFLDEIGELPLAQQAALLRVLETQTVRRVGAENEITVSPRVVAATNNNLYQQIREGKFREDLFYRINVLTIHVPPLREREGDIEQLATHFLAEYAAEHGTPEMIAPAALARLMAHQWPGNVRELKHTLLRAAILNRDKGCIDTLPEDFDRPPAWTTPDGGLAAGMSIRDMERSLIEKTLEHYGGNRKKTADALGVSQKTLYNRLKDYEDQPADE